MASILIIDDEAPVRDMLRQMFEREGYQVIDAPNGDVGIKLYKQNNTDLVITDLIMPEKEGIETIGELKRDFPDIKIIAMSGGGRIGPDSYLEMARKLGAKVTITKPIKRKELIEIVDNLLKE